VIHRRQNLAGTCEFYGCLHSRRRLLLTSLCPSISSHVSERLPLDRLLWNCIVITPMKICQQNPNLVKIGRNIGHFTWRRIFLLLPAKLSRSKCAVFDRSDVSWWSYPKRGINVMRTRQNIILNQNCLFCCTQINRRLSRNVRIFVNTEILLNDWYFCHQTAWHWMECRIGETIPFDSCTSSK
jgi:hypothetical protein